MVNVRSMLHPVFGDFVYLTVRQMLGQIINFGIVVTSAFMLWRGLILATNSESPIVVVLSGSMEPSFYRGDLLLITNYDFEPLRVGESVVYKLPGRDIPIIHRIIKLHEVPDDPGSPLILTKGDNNEVHDRRGIYSRGTKWLKRQDIVGRARVFLPQAGMVTILMNDYPQFKFVLLGVLGFFVLIHRE
eukprot:Clim_evm35s253 gene=Clim_evmTU35s253